MSKKLTKRDSSLSPGWKTTKEACELLGISRWTLAALREDGTLKKGYHWKVKNPNAARLTYLWHCDRIHTVQCEVLEA